MTTPIAGGKITREALLAAALEIIGLVHAGVDGEDADQAGQVEETPHRPAAGRGRCRPPPRPVARRTPSQTTTRPSRECAWLNATLSRFRLAAPPPRPRTYASSGDALAQGCHHSPFGVTVPFAHGLEGADRSAVDVSAKIMPTL